MVGPTSMVFCVRMMRKHQKEKDDMSADELFTPDFQARPYWWEAAAPVALPESELPGKTDVCIIGGGYTGLSCALELRRQGISCLVLDAQRIGEGASSRNGGLVTGGTKIALSALSSGADPEFQTALVEEAIGTLSFLQQRLEEEEIECDFTRVGRFNCAATPAHYRRMAQTADRLAEVTGEPVYMVSRERQWEEISSDYYYGGQVLEAGATLHPAKYVQGLANAVRKRGATLIDSCRVERMQQMGGGWQLQTSRGVVEAQHVVLGTNGYTGSEFAWFRRRVVPVASFMIATEELPERLTEELSPRKRAMADSRRVLNYFRVSPDGKRILWGGRVGTRGMDERESARRLHAKMCAAWPQLARSRITHSWHGNVAFTFDFLPHLGSHRGVYYALGCQGNGVAMQSWLGFQLALSVARGRCDSAFARKPFRTAPFYSGTPWFLPAVLAWYALRDRIDQLAA